MLNNTQPKAFSNNFQCKSESQKYFSMERKISSLLGLLHVYYVRCKPLFQYWLIFKAFNAIYSPIASADDHY